MAAETQQTAYECVLAEIMASRGISGVEELKDRLRSAGHHQTARKLTEAPPGGFGQDLHEVLHLDDREKVHLSRAWADTFLGVHRLKRIEETPTCAVPECERVPVEDSSFTICKEHRAVFDAQADEEAWDLALSILNPWVEATRKIGSPELTGVMERALEEAEEQLNRVLDERERADAAL